MWRDQAACAGADPINFDPVDLHTQNDWEVLTRAAQNWCTTCPVRDACRADGDANRHQGLWGGVYRRVLHGRYEWTVLADGATEPQLTDRRSITSRAGRGAA